MLYVKRIIALPTERVSIVDGIVEVNGAPLIEPYVEKRAAVELSRRSRSAPREYFVIGDNRSMKMGDHDFGRVDARRILGMLLF